MEKTREKGIVKTSIIGIGGNILLVGAKAFVGLLANSVSIIVDALNNLSDALSSLITIIGTKLSNKRPDKKHPYGHGRVEYITSTLIGVLVLIAGFTAIYESIRSIVDYFTTKVLPEYNNWSFIIIAIAIAVKVILGLFFRFRGKKFNSDPLKASGIDALFDSLLSLGTLVGALVSNYAHFYVEGYIGIIIGLFIIKSGIGVIRESVSHMIGSRVDEEFKKTIKSEIQNVEGVNGVYDLILNNYGINKYFGSVHVGVENTLTAKEIQKIEREISAIMYLKYGIIMTTGIYADNDETEVSKKIKDSLINMIKGNPNILQLHGYYVDEATKIVTFDLVMSFDDKDPETTINQIANKLKEQFPNYIFIANLDLDI